MATFASANMTAADGTDLASYTDSGSLHTTFHHPHLGFWSLAAIKIFSNQAFLQSTNPSAYIPSGTPATADYDVSATVNIAASSPNQSTGVMGRCVDGSSTFTYYNFSYSRATGQYSIGTDATSLVAVSGSPSTGSHVFMLRMRGTTISGWVDGVQVCTVTDSTYTAAGVPALYLYSTSGLSDTITAFSAVDAPVTLTAGSVTATAASNTSVTVTGTACSGGTSTFTYQYERSPDGSTWTNVGSAQSGLGSGVAPSNYTDTGLTTGNTYYYRYQVTDSASQTAYTSSVSVVVSVRSPTTYYVANAGSDSNNGTSTGTAWQTISKVNSFGQVPGDTIRFNGGDTFSGNLTLSTSGTFGSPITINSYGTGKAIISCGTGTGIAATNVGYIMISNLTVTGSGVTFTAGSPNTVSYSSSGFGIHFLNTSGAILSGVVVDACLVTGTYEGITLGDSGTVRSYGYAGPRITNNTVHDCVNTGIRTVNYTNYTPGIFTYPYVADNRVYNIYGNWTGSAGTNSGYPMQVVCSTGGTIYGNLLHDSGSATQPSGGGPCGLILVGCTGTVAASNVIYNLHSQSGADGTGIDLDGLCTNCEVYGNYIVGCDGAGLELGNSVGASTGNLYHCNVIQGCGNVMAHSGVYVFGTASGNYFHSNTFYKSGSGAPVFVTLSGTANTFANNIVITRSSATIGTMQSGDVLTGNFYDCSSFSITKNGTTYTSLSALQAVAETVAGVAVGIAATAGLSSVGTGSTSPTLPASSISAYDPTVSSNVLNAGVDIATLYAINPGLFDFHGNRARTGESATANGFACGAATAAAPAGTTTYVIFGTS